MKTTPLLVLLCFLLGYNLAAQIGTNVYKTTLEEDFDRNQYELKINDNYMVLSVYSENPAKFVKTFGGFYTTDGDSLHLKMEFNSNYAKDSLRQRSFKYEIDGERLLLNGTAFEGLPKQAQELDGTWLFATRGPDEGQERRGEQQARKTLKFLLNGHFQWIAYHTETFRFSGTGGGSFSSKDGVYKENIAYFSRDNSRAGAELEFNYTLEGKDWHHKGKNSRGEPMYEIWARRD